MLAAPRAAVLSVLLAACVALGACSRRDSASGPTGGASPLSEPALRPSADAARALPEAGRVPSDLGQLPVPPDNPQTEPKIALGSRLFFERRLSADGKLACYSCHQDEDGNGGHDPIATGANGVSVGMHSPVLWNVGYLPALYWNGRARTLEEQATQALIGKNMGLGEGHLEAKAKEIGDLPEYRDRFAAAFPGVGATATTLVQALAAYERTLVCSDTAYDRFARGDATALSLRQRRGLGVFLGKGVCTACHTPPHFTSAVAVPGGTYFNIGIGWAGKSPEAIDPGRRSVTGRDEDFGAFKPPTLRNVTRSAPYFHDGSVPTLKEAVRFMASGGLANPYRSPLLRDRGLTEAEITDLVAFLGALECGKIGPPPDTPTEALEP